MKSDKTFYIVAVITLAVAAIAGVVIYAVGGMGKNSERVTTELKIMSFNIQAELWGGKPIEGRDEKLNTVLESYQPDVCGIQEMTALWYERFEPYIGKMYDYTDRFLPSGETAYTTIMYNKEKALLIEHGIKVYSAGNDPKLRLLAWGLFENKSTHEQYIVTSTHWDIGSNEWMIDVQAEEMGHWVKELHDKYKVPVLSTGDYNRGVASSQFQNFVSISGFKDANTSPEITDQDKEAKTIDHIMASQDVNFKKFVILRDDFSTSISDHKPMYADITI